MLRRLRIDALVVLVALAPTAVLALTVAVFVMRGADETGGERVGSSRPLLVVAVALVVVVIGVGVALVRVVRRSVGRLTEATNATVALARAVAVPERVDPGDPVPHLEPIVVGDHDVLAGLVHALNAMRADAVQLAAGQAAARRALVESCVNLGRRNQTLIARQLEFIDQLERDEEDPDALRDLFHLDHLATRMRRNAESLLVLAGAPQTRRWSEGIDIGTVVRSALCEIEAYHRVELGALDIVEVRGGVVADLVHLLAELLENATVFSPPTSPVRVKGRFLAEGYVVSIADEGIGMDPVTLEEANRRVSEAPPFERTPSRMIGLEVVGRLASRHRIGVRLIATPERGVTARVLLPVSVIESRAAPAAAAPVGLRCRAPAPSLDLGPDPSEEDCGDLGLGGGEPSWSRWGAVRRGEGIG